MKYINILNCKVCNKVVNSHSSATKYCKDCAKVISKEQCRLNVAIWRKTHPDFKERKKIWDKKYSIIHAKEKKEYNASRPFIVREAWRIAKHIKIKNECTVCESSKYIQRHHPDYNRPAYVIPMCAKCHKDFHIIYGGFK